MRALSNANPTQGVEILYSRVQALRGILEVLQTRGLRLRWANASDKCKRARSNIAKPPTLRYDSHHEGRAYRLLLLPVRTSSICSE
jgi:hypothetical protein